MSSRSFLLKRALSLRPLPTAERMRFSSNSKTSAALRPIRSLIDLGIVSCPLEVIDAFILMSLLHSLMLNQQKTIHLEPATWRMEYFDVTQKTNEASQIFIRTELAKNIQHLLLSCRQADSLKFYFSLFARTGCNKTSTPPSFLILLLPL